jgi:hypothetical protein
MFLSADTTTDDNGTTANINDSLQIPLSYNEMITQTSQAMSDAYNKMGYSRQIVRILLPRDSRSGQLGEYYENEAQTERGKSQEIKLVPTDESWQGGIMQVRFYPRGSHLRYTSWITNAYFFLRAPDKFSLALPGCIAHCERYLTTAVSHRSSDRCTAEDCGRSIS